jgi:hypothetical protein
MATVINENSELLKEVLTELKKLNQKPNSVIDNTLWCNCNGGVYTNNLCNNCGGLIQFNYSYKGGQ